MSQKAIAFEISTSDSTIKILRDAIELTKIACEGDINFTPLIDILTQQLDTEDTYSISPLPSTNIPKYEITLKILEQIIEKFNAAQIAQMAEISSPPQPPSI